METRRTLTVLTLTNLGIVISRGAEAQIRSADSSVAKDGTIYAETALFRLLRPDGRPSVKITTSEEGSGLTLGGGVAPTYIVLDASGGDASLSLMNKERRHELMKP